MFSAEAVLGDQRDQRGTQADTDQSGAGDRDRDRRVPRRRDAGRDAERRGDREGRRAASRRRDRWRLLELERRPGGLAVAEDDLLIGLAFSGGGTRAAAFSFGVLSAFDDIPVPRASDKLLDRLDFISGVSGGSVTAAYFGLKKRAALSDFRERFLLQNAEEGLQTTLSLATMGRALGGGINDQQGFTRWLDAHLFHGATYGQFRAVGPPRGRPAVRIRPVLPAAGSRGAIGGGVGRVLLLQQVGRDLFQEA